MGVERELFASGASGDDEVALLGFLADFVGGVNEA